MGYVEQLAVRRGVDVDPLDAVFEDGLRSIEIKMPKSLVARTQPCFTPLLTGKALEVTLLK